MYEDIYNDYYYNAKSVLSRDPSSCRRNLVYPPPPPGPGSMHLPARFYHQESKREEAARWCTMSKERCSMLTILGILFLAATAVATMFTTQEVRRTSCERGGHGMLRQG